MELISLKIYSGVNIFDLALNILKRLLVADAQVVAKLLFLSLLNSVFKKIINS